VDQHLFQPVWEKHGVWICLHNPVIPPTFWVFLEAVPEATENWCVEGRMSFSSKFALQRTVHNIAVQCFFVLLAEADCFVAVDGPLSACKDADLVFKMLLQQPRLISPPKHDGCAKKSRFFFIGFIC